MQPDVRSQDALGWPQLGHHRAITRRVVGSFRCPGQAVVHRVRVVADRRGVRHRTNEAVVLAQLGQARHQLVDVHTGHRGGDRLVRTADFHRCLRFHVPDVDVRRAAPHHDEDAGLLGRGRLRSWFASTCGYSRIARAQRTGQAQPEHAEPAHVKQLPAREFTAQRRPFESERHAQHEIPRGRRRGSTGGYLARPVE